MRQHFAPKTVNGIMSFFAPEIVSFDILPPLEAVGARTFVTHWQEFFGAYQSLEVEFPEVSITASDDIAFNVPYVWLWAAAAGVFYGWLALRFAISMLFWGCEKGCSKLVENNSVNSQFSNGQQTA